jgi:hypothetical protein
MAMILYGHLPVSTPKNLDTSATIVLMYDEEVLQSRRALERRKSRTYTAMRAGLAVIAALAVTLIVWGLLALTHRQTWPAASLVSAAHSASYPIYYPTKLPNGFSPRIDTPKVSDDVFIYTLTYDGNKKLFVSAIPKPTRVQFDDFYNRILSNKTNVLNPAGTAVVGTANDQPVGSLVTTQTWVTMNAPGGIDTQRLQALVTSLKEL